MRKKQNSKNIRAYKILEVFAKERSVNSVIDKIPGISEEDIWKAVLDAASLMKGVTYKIKDDGVYRLNVDGSAIPNPGNAGIGIVISNSAGKTVKKISRYIGYASNNIAEYTAMIEGLKEVRKFTAKVSVCSDSELLIRQLNGLYRVKDEELKGKYLIVKDLEKDFIQINYTHVLRKNNSEADELANSAAKKKM